MFDLVESLGGSISAEHGIGRLKAAEFARRCRSGGTRGHARAETGARPEGHHESGQGAVRTLMVPVRTGRLESARIRRNPTFTRCSPIRRIRGSRDIFFLAPATRTARPSTWKSLLASQRERPRTRFELAVEEIASAAESIGACDLSLIEPNVVDLGYMLGEREPGARDLRRKWPSR